VSDPFQPSLDLQDGLFNAALGATEDGDALIVDLDGFEGPLHVLLALARAQKVDLLKLSVSRLAEQYLAFVREARQRRFGLAADYLVMAAWLTYLKSRLLLPKPAKSGREEEPDARDLAAGLAFRLAKLDAMRRMGEALMALPRTGRDVFGRGDPEAAVVHAEPRFDADLYALVSAYADQRRRSAGRRYDPSPRVGAFPLEVARDRLRRLMAELTDWTPLGGVAPFPDSHDPVEGPAGRGPSRASYVASTLSAGLELVKEGELEAQQLEAFAEIFLRRRPGELFEAA
jgi:segregation and condensation protein A